jgi:hypothetical protein
MDFLSTSRGGKFDDARQPGVGWAAYPYTGRSGYECMPSYLSDAHGPFGRNVDATRAIRDAIRAEGLRTPVVCTGGVHRFEQAEEILARAAAAWSGSRVRPSPTPTGRASSPAAGATPSGCASTPTTARVWTRKHKQVTCKLSDRRTWMRRAW